MTSLDQRVKRFHRSLKYEHLYRREIDTAADLAEEVASFFVSFTRSGRMRRSENGHRIPGNPPRHTCVGANSP